MQSGTMTERQQQNAQRLYAMQFAKLYPAWLAKVEKKRLTGGLAFQKSKPGSGTWATYARDKTTSKALATSTPHPTRGTSFRITYGGSSPYLGSHPLVRTVIKRGYVLQTS